MTLGESIRSARKKIGLTQAALAERIDVHEVTLRNWERGEYQPKTTDFQKLCSALNVTEAELLNGPTSNEVRVEIIIKRSNEEDKEEMDLSKDAPYLESLTLTPEKIGVKLIFDKGKSLREICDTILQDEEKFESARKALYGE
jgi:transcriptional regulator with XRE-family HTH domain